MKKIMTAIGDQNLNQKLKQESDFEVVGNDIPYQEGIIEVLEKRQVDFLILSELLQGEMDLKELIEKIKAMNSNIQMILFLEKQNTDLENYLYAKGIYSIFYDNQIEIAEIIKIIRENEPNKQNENKQLKQEQSQIICVSGTSGVGKSIFSVNLAKACMESKNKILMIDFDVLNNSLHTILGIKKYPEKVANKIKNQNLLEPLQVEELIMKINHKVDLIAGISLLFDGQYQISKVKVKTILQKLKEIYEVIIIDTSSECFLDYTKEIMKHSNFNIFMLEPNLIEIKKAKNLLNIYINQWEIPQSEFNILFNKYNENSIDSSILKNIFSGFNILGKLSNSSQYNLIINKNDTAYLKNELQKEYRNIFKRLLKIECPETKIRRSLWKKY